MYKITGVKHLQSGRGLALYLETQVGYYAEAHEFLNWDEVNEFVAKLKAKAEKVFGPDSPIPSTIPRPLPLQVSKRTF